ncbi:MAG TPA: pYEATS domain-containing protein [Solirubrobacteraceae bacterium]|jgi:hypothetical protein|nr:pYEATS domain-containing protein [Solirubrobacteraceae bacterium]
MRIEQEASFIGDGRWQWAVWISGPDAELDAIAYVEYTLHPTFAEPVRRVEDRSAKFRLEETGSAGFEINARAVRRDTGIEELHHALRLDGGGPSQSPDTASSQPVALVSFGSADAELGQEVQDLLGKLGFETVATDDTLELGLPWEGSIASAVADAGIVLGVFSDASSPWVERELSAALAGDAEVVPIAIGPDAVVPDWLKKDTHVIDVENSGELANALDSVAKAFRA